MNISDQRMAKTKTKETKVKIIDFVDSFVEDDQKKTDTYKLIELMKKWTGFEPKMWGPSIIGFGSYHYKYASGHEGDAPMLGFSPRKAAFSLYVYSPTPEHEHLLKDLGKFKMSKACIYIKKLSDINIPTLKKICEASIAYLNEHHECACRAK
jgi:hypothetical protein